MTATYEARHLELREALAQRGAAWREVAARRRLDAFHERTGAAVDEVVAEARRVARHEAGPSQLRSLVAALDEEAARG